MCSTCTCRGVLWVWTLVAGELLPAEEHNILITSWRGIDEFWSKTQRSKAQNTNGLNTNSQHTTLCWELSYHINISKFVLLFVSVVLAGEWLACPCRNFRILFQTLIPGYNLLHLFTSTLLSSWIEHQELARSILSVSGVISKVSQLWGEFFLCDCFLYCLKLDELDLQHLRCTPTWYAHSGNLPTWHHRHLTRAWFDAATYLFYMCYTRTSNRRLRTLVCLYVLQQSTCISDKVIISWEFHHFSRDCNVSDDHTLLSLLVSRCITPTLVSRCKLIMRQPNSFMQIVLFI
jgi:hypothetical protein